ncbi:hypothetical protein FRB96_003352 [Tulasnella sp. 330]|nr:hypothetical protein FRB96_003352 [Tulasnella sp. 330]KAG8879702.1 hypothetical protein FRB97_001499 [Tulasnella sp. 331]KAG8885547.1 hypothetical protein FRB98_001775 [Tulasnella sp. 332]
MEELIENSPLLWATVALGDPLRVVTIALVKSGSSSLDVIYNKDVLRRSARPSEAESLTLALQHVQRWRTFDVMIDETDELLELMAGHHAPQLQELSLINTGHFESTEDIFEGPTPQLRRVKLHHSLAVPWNSALLSNLQVLHISELLGEGPCADEVDSILRASPALVELTLQALLPQDGDEPPIQRTRPVELLSLRRLTVGGQTPELTTHILDNLRIPNCENIIIQITPKTSYSTRDGVFRSAQAIAEASDSAIVDLREDRIDLEYRKEKEVVLAVCVWREEWEFNAAERTLGLFDTSSNLDVDVLLEARLGQKSDSAKIFSLLPGLHRAKSLRLMETPYLYCTDESNALIRALGVSTSVDGTLHWPLPCLETLSIESTSSHMGALLAVIRARLQAEVDPPSKLKSLELPKKLKKHFSEFESLLGKGVVGCTEELYHSLDHGVVEESESKLLEASFGVIL